ncbi:ciliated left-right organizer metallopeptidase [Betta splendens]|uniref:Leishmanolysin-like peptidase n=1 Tax=Betta splendens TaxID=158456 RepID=A0A9W2XBD5_BETSP|nr:ciliated left-right organizer metallopeptidase [Betta splendens]
MALRRSRSLWVWTVVVMLVLLRLPESLQKCVFDEVQARVRVVRAADEPPSALRSEAPAGRPGWTAPAPLGFSVAQTEAAEEKAPPTGPSPQPIRIQTWIPSESDNLSDAEKQRVEAAVQEAVRTVSSLLSVDRAPGPLLLSRDINKYCKFVWRNSSAVNYNRCGRANKSYRAETCLDVTIPDDHLAGCEIYPEAHSPRSIALRPEGPGLAGADFLLYLHIKSTDECRAKPGVLAYAAHCRSGARGRPLAGVVVVCRHRLAEDTYEHAAAAQMLIHELIHALGFSKHLFHTWRDASSASLDGSGQMRLYTRSVTSAMQGLLASTDPELGGPLENLDVAPGGVSSHWESRALRGSIMTAALEDWTTVRIDPVTLAALQDTGWYKVDLTRAQSLVWGDGEGAMFGSLSTCKDNTSSFFCSGSGRGCHFLHLHKGACQTDPYLEGCQVYKILHNGSECWKKENKLQSAQNLSGEVFGSDSRCFFSNLTRQNHSPPPSFSSPVVGCCYRHRCTGPNQYQIQVSDSDWLDCPAGRTVQINGYWGFVFCPDRRLCLFPDVSPPSGDISAVPASTFSSVFPSGTSAHGTFRAAAEVTAVSALSFTAAVSVLAAAVACVRKCGSRRMRIRSSGDDAADPEPGGRNV